MKVCAARMAYPNRGFTLIELLVTIALVAILAGLGVPAFQTMRINAAISESASELSLAVQSAQNTALKINRTVVVAPVVAGDWTSGWNVFVKLDTNFTYDAGVDTLVLMRESLSSGVGVVSNTSTCASININSSGYAAGNATCRVVFGSSETGRYKHVIIASFGRARICDGKTATDTACDD